MEEHVLGYAAMAFISIIHLPQLVHTFRLKSAQEVSWGLIFTSAMVSALSTSYGLIIRKPPLYVANAISGVQVLLLAGMKRRYGRRRPGAAAAARVAPADADDG